MKRTLAGIIVIFALFAQSGVFAQTRAGELVANTSTINATTITRSEAKALSEANTDSLSTTVAPKADISIAFFDRTLYYPGDSKNNPVYVRVNIANHGSDTLRFKVADDKKFSIDFAGLTVKNSQLSQTDNLTRKRTTNQTVYFREISLEPGEEYAFVENVKEYLTIDEPSIYYIEMRFYPNLIQNRNVSFSSNRLTLDVRPLPSAASSNSLPIENGSAVILQPEEISPDKVVEQTIIARQRSLWDQYFLYMDLEQMLQRDSAQNRRYRATSADERARMLDVYKADLMQSRIDRDIVAIPQRFEIEKTTYSQTDGSVTVLEWFQYPNYVEKKRYTYHVHQRDGIWMINDYSVDNLGTE